MGYTIYLISINFSKRKELTTLMNPIPSATTKHPQVRTHLLVRIALVTAITCILAPLSIPLPFSPVPLSLTNLVLYISIFILGWKARHCKLPRLSSPRSYWSSCLLRIRRRSRKTRRTDRRLPCRNDLSHNPIRVDCRAILKKTCSHLDRNAARLRSKLSVWNCLALCTTPPILCRRSDDRSSSLSLF